MIKVQYKLSETLCGRTAIFLNWKLQEVDSFVYIITPEDRMINAKSLLGLLSGSLKQNDIITIAFEKEELLSNIESIFNTVGDRIKEE